MIFKLIDEACLYYGDFPGGTSGKEPTCQSRRHKRRGFDPWVGKMAWRRTWQPTPVVLPGEYHGQKSLVGYSPSRLHHNLTQVSTHTHTHTHTHARTHIMKGYLLYFNVNGWEISITSRNIFPATPRQEPEQIFGHSGLAKVTCKLSPSLYSAIQS